VEDLDAGSYYQVLCDGKAKLLLGTRFSEVDYKEFNSAVTTKRIDKVQQLFGCNKGTMVKLSKGEPDLMNLLGDKATLVSDFIKQKGLKCKKQPDLEAVFNYYNSLQ